MDSLLDSMISFAATGEIGPFRLGMPGGEADLLLGGGTALGAPAAARPAEDGDAGVKDGSLEVWAGPDGLVHLLGFDAVDTAGRFAAPSRAGTAGRGATGSTEATEVIEAPTREAVLDGLRRTGCRWRDDDALTFDDQLAVQTQAGVSVVFSRPRPPADGWVLASLYRSADRR
ncbi:hypothetical protein [Kitasatospora sp. NPDC048538]|uniref:hypothetical protein n=1 Tax=unclassified Kitasatospora TaxID=2633591 RepID=UPI0033F29D72